MSLWTWLEDLFFVVILKWKKVIVADVLSSAGIAVAGQRISVAYQKAGSSLWSSDGTASTNGTGMSTNTVYLKPGTYNFRATFAGAAGYDPATAQLNNVLV